jgi:hypothetical protein
VLDFNAEGPTADTHIAVAWPGPACGNVTWAGGSSGGRLIRSARDGRAYRPNGDRGAVTRANRCALAFEGRRPQATRLSQDMERKVGIGVVVRVPSAQLQELESLASSMAGGEVGHQSRAVRGRAAEAGTRRTGRLPLEARPPVGVFSREQTVELPDVAGVESASESDDPVLDLAGGGSLEPGSPQARRRAPPSPQRPRCKDRRLRYVRAREPPVD